MLCRRGLRRAYRLRCSCNIFHAPLRFVTSRARAAGTRLSANDETAEPSLITQSSRVQLPSRRGMAASLRDHERRRHADWHLRRRGLRLAAGELRCHVVADLSSNTARAEEPARPVQLGLALCRDDRQFYEHSMGRLGGSALACLSPSSGGSDHRHCLSAKEPVRWARGVVHVDTGTGSCGRNILTMIVRASARPGQGCTAKG